MARVGSLYRFVSVLMDRNIIEENTIVRVSPASRFGVSGRLPSPFAYIEHLNGERIQMVCSNSLVPLNPKERAIVRKAITPRAPSANRCGRIPSSRLVLEGIN
jgi:hypothetical protein